MIFEKLNLEKIEGNFSLMHFSQEYDLPVLSSRMVN